MQQFRILQILALLPIALCGCGEENEKDEVAWYADSVKLYADYNLAVDRVRQFTIADASEQIIRVGEPGEDSRMNWRTINNVDMVRMVSFVSESVYTDWKVGEPFVYEGEDPLWTAFPFDWERHKTDFAGLDSLASHMRMVQICGLPPNAEDDHMVFLYVQRSGLMRPAPDPNPATTTFTSMDCVESASDSYKAWYAANTDFSYNSDTPYPWTRLGYTYDWNTVTDDFGVSEFIVPAGTLVYVEKVMSYWSWVKSL